MAPERLIKLGLNRPLKYPAFLYGRSQVNKQTVLQTLSPLLSGLWRPFFLQYTFTILLGQSYSLLLWNTVFPLLLLEASSWKR